MSESVTAIIQQKALDVIASDVKGLASLEETGRLVARQPNTRQE
jgi:hypothetical protein